MDRLIPCCSPKKAQAETSNPPTTRGVGPNKFSDLTNPSQGSARGRRFTVILEKLPGKEWGFQFDVGNREGLLVTGVTDGGFISQYNASWPSPMIEPGDCIEQVDDVNKSQPAMQALLQEKSKVKMIIRKPWRFAVSLTKPKGVGDLGIDWAGYKEGLLVLNVQKGFITEYNQSNPNQKIQAGDCIEEVNGVKESWEMRELVESADNLEMVVRKSKQYWYNEDMATPNHDEIPIPLQTSMSPMISPSTSYRETLMSPLNSPSASYRETLMSPLSSPSASYRETLAQPRAGYQPSLLYSRRPSTQSLTPSTPSLSHVPQVSTSASTQSLSYGIPTKPSISYV